MESYVLTVKEHKELYERIEAAHRIPKTEYESVKVLLNKRELEELMHLIDWLR